MADDDRLGFFEQRRARKLAQDRQAQWDALRAGTPEPAPAAHPAQAETVRALPPLATRPPQPTQSSIPAGAKLAAAALPVLAAVLAIVTASLGLPLFREDVQPAVLATGCALVAGAVYLAARVGGNPGAGKARNVGLVLALVLLGSFAAGAFTQAVVQGKAQVTGSEGDRVYRQGQEILQSAEVLATTQRLLRLPVEQARTLGTMFDAAIAQDAEIAARWNPATAGQVTPPGLAEAYARINVAAARQSEALAARKQALLSPDTQLDAIVAAAYADVERLLADGPDGVAAAVRQSYLEAGIVTGAGP